MICWVTFGHFDNNWFLSMNSVNELVLQEKFAEILNLGDQPDKKAVLQMATSGTGFVLETTRMNFNNKSKEIEEDENEEKDIEEEDDNQKAMVVVTYICNMNLKGWIPTFAAEYLGQQQVALMVGGLVREVKGDGNQSEDEVESAFPVKLIGGFKKFLVEKTSKHEDSTTEEEKSFLENFRNFVSRTDVKEKEGGGEEINPSDEVEHNVDVDEDDEDEIGEKVDIESEEKGKLMLFGQFLVDNAKNVVGGVRGTIGAAFEKVENQETEEKKDEDLTAQLDDSDDEDLEDKQNGSV
eukprot:TRINITY_DN3172_c0_g1_i1.p1 TRINITY_DN3172_c0_g1~~TRINITY_DN3172_c0_g1_i1.p1  ORF type:complete len:295 (-),score=104.45 TRINITY_DN3172_c0_g1_i1:62-946(-)